jgi:LPS-assembly protein
MKLFYQSIYFFYFIIICPFLAIAKEDQISQTPIEINADRFEYSSEKENRLVQAYGNVEALQDNQKVTANFMEYNFDKDTLLAKDQVKMIEKNGYEIDAQKITLFNQMKFGSISDFKVLTPDKSTLKGKFAKKENEKVSNIEKGFYTSCKICPGKSPIWAITASSAELDQEENSVKYRNALFKLYGMPVIYTPYFFNYTSKAKRKSGFLTPEYGSSTYLGKMVRIPYYINIAPNHDATVKLVATSLKGKALEAEHRYLLPQGQVNSFGSITTVKQYNNLKPKNTVRQTFQSKADLSISDRRNIGWDINMASDKSYRKDYDYGKEDFLTSRIYNNAYQSNGYYEIQSLFFQNLRPDNPTATNPINQTPMALPLFESKHKIFEFDDNSNLSFESNILNVHRYNGPDTNRISIKNTWEKNLLLDNGHNFDFFASLRNDIYHYNKAYINNQKYTGSVARHIPEAGVNWSYPLSRYFGSSKVMISPLVKAIITPNSKYNDKIYSEDSSSISELTDGNLFAKSHFSGLDLVENTPRVSYGIKSMAYYKDYLNVSALFGQMYKHTPQTYDAGQTKSHLSDYVGRLQFDINDSIILTYRYKLDKDSLSNKANEIENILKYKKLYLLTNLLYYKDDLVVNQVKNRREIYLETGINDYNNFSMSINARKNLSNRKDNPNLYVDPNGFISIGSGIKYLNDCILYSASINRDYTRNQDKKPNTTYWFRISFKNIS